MEEKIKLSSLLKHYEEIFSKKDKKYEFYFEEAHIERKVKKLRQFYEVLGDISLKDRYFKAIMYYGQTEQQIKHVEWIGKTLLKYDDIPDELISEILLCYSERIFSKYPVEEYFDSLVKEYGMTEITFKEFSKYLDMKSFELRVIDFEYGVELIDLAKVYGTKFIDKIYDLIKEKKVELSKILEILPSKEFIDKSIVHVPIGYDILSGEDIVTRIIRGYVDIDKFKDDEKIVLGPCSDGSYVRTSFTKKEYLDEIKKQQLKLEKK